MRLKSDITKAMVKRAPECATSALESAKIVTIMTLLQKYRVLLAGFIVGVALAGVTAFPLNWEIALLAQWLRDAPLQIPGLTAWVAKVSFGLNETDAKFPFLAYGTDWLAFAHLMIAIAYIGPWREPVRNRWVLEWGLICCVCVIPLALICGPIRGIPWGWTLVDCAFSVVGFPVLWTLREWSKALEIACIKTPIERTRELVLSDY